MTRALGHERRIIQRRAALAVRSAEGHRKIAIANGWHRPVIDAIVDICRDRSARLNGG